MNQRYPPHSLAILQLDLYFFLASLCPSSLLSHYESLDVGMKTILRCMSYSDATASMCFLAPQHMVHGAILQPRRNLAPPGVQLTCFSFRRKSISIAAYGLQGYHNSRDPYATRFLWRKDAVTGSHKSPLGGVSEER
ncbi:hypothetical protein GGI43DRAFT_118435 [Trichoderma evansii]